MSSAPRGAVLVIGLGLIGTIAMLVVVLARSAVITNDKSRSMALADASAKSVATWYAQILNYDAYSNRAIAANEIMMAQAVTLASWTQYAQNLSTNIGTVASLIPAVEPVAAWIQQTATLAHQMAKSGALVEVPLRSAYTRALQGSQQIMHAAATPFAAQAMVNEVIWTSDARFFGQIIPSSNISAFTRFSKNYSGNDRKELASLVSRSQDAFTKNRQTDSRLYLWPTTGCIPTSLDRAFSKLIKRGGTWLGSDMSDWESADTLSVHTWRRKSRWNPTCGSLREAIPLGWGAANASVNGADGIQEDPVSAGINPAAFANAKSDRVRIPGYLGLSGHRELSLTGNQSRQNAAIRVPVLVRLPASKIAKVSAGKTMVPSEAEGAVGNAVWSLSVGETFFQRPPDTMTDPFTREFGNLFSPFWASRLVSPSTTDRSLSLLMAQGRKGQQ